MTCTFCKGKIRSIVLALGLLMSAPGYAANYVVLGDTSEPASVSGFLGTMKLVNVGEFSIDYEPIKSTAAPSRFEIIAKENIA